VLISGQIYFAASLSFPHARPTPRANGAGKTTLLKILLGAGGPVYSRGGRLDLTPGEQVTHRGISISLHETTGDTVQTERRRRVNIYANAVGCPLRRIAPREAGHDSLSGEFTKEKAAQ
jgi:hypothetical protein